MLAFLDFEDVGVLLFSSVFLGEFDVAASCSVVDVLLLVVGDASVDTG